MKLRNKKTGEIGDLIGTERSCPYITIGIDFHDGNPRAFDYTCLAELNEEWEDYKPTEPLIKDEKIRKAVRAWAEANGIDHIVSYILEDGIEFAGNATRLDIRFEQSLVIDTDRIYSIAELCGEEEE